MIKVKFTSTRINILSEISRDVAQVLFAGLFIEPIAKGSINLTATIFGLILSLVAWAASILLHS